MQLAQSVELVCAMKERMTCVCVCGGLNSWKCVIGGTAVGNKCHICDKKTPAR